MRKERPELHPRDYEAQDKRFHDFIHCRSSKCGGRAPTLWRAAMLLSGARDDWGWVEWVCATKACMR